MDERYLGVEAYSGDEEYIFISYKRESIGFIRHIISSTVEEMIKRNRVPNFWYDRAIESGDEWQKTVIEKAKNAKCMIVFIDSMSINSPHVRNELNNAFESNVPIVSVYLENIENEIPMKVAYWLTGSDYGLNVNKLTQEALIDTLIRAVYNALDGIVANKKETRPNTVDEFEEKLKSADYYIDHYVSHGIKESYTLALSIYEELALRRAFDPRPRMGLIKCAAASREAKTDETLNILSDHWSYIDPSKKDECQQQYHDMVLPVINDEIASIESAYTNESNIKYKLTTATGETNVINEIIDKLNALKGHKSLNESYLSDFKDHIDAVIAKHNRRKQQLSGAVEKERIESERQAAINREEYRKKENRNKLMFVSVFAVNFIMLLIAGFMIANIGERPAPEGSIIILGIVLVAIAVFQCVYFFSHIYSGKVWAVIGIILFFAVNIVIYMILGPLIFSKNAEITYCTLAILMAFIPVGTTFIIWSFLGSGNANSDNLIGTCIVTFIASAVAYLFSIDPGSAFVAIIILGIINIIDTVECKKECW